MAVVIVIVVVIIEVEVEVFYIPHQAETRIGNSEFSTPSGRRNLEVVIVVVVEVVAPLS